MVLQQGDTHLARITKHTSCKTTVNHTDTLLLNVNKKSRSVRNEILNFHEGGFTNIRNLNVNRKTLQLTEIFVPQTAYRKPVVNRKILDIVEVFAPVFLQRIKQHTKVNRITMAFTP